MLSRGKSFLEACTAHLLCKHNFLEADTKLISICVSLVIQVVPWSGVHRLSWNIENS